MGMDLSGKSEDIQAITGVGAALMDYISAESEAFIEHHRITRGGMTLVSNERIAELLAATEGTVQKSPGGSACNTITGYAKLGGAASFVGSIGKDSTGRLLTEHLCLRGVSPCLLEKDTPTGRVLSIVTPDGERSMQTFLGASADTAPADITEKMFSSCGLVHIEGYLFFNRDLIISVAEAARRKNRLISLDLASFTVVESDREAFQYFVRTYVDIVFANEEEARAYTGAKDDEAAVRSLSEDTTIAVVKQGSRGSLIFTQETLYDIPPVTMSHAPVDTTGAGDLWAAGFLYAYLHGASIDTAGRLGSLCGYEVCQVQGAQIPEEKWEYIRREWRALQGA
ncbi:adenosine kinase [Chitinivibrio alkaliphilus]|uniref:Ribokinase/pfkB superfamily kinase n=1 Tax=Chitinivibrio alkaliphilus ACht1 TaxID=1313304 RepID=U7DEG7_9BACT|nr:adenosine kinase [Chitinivibrio alkaliphilus]ERP39316.1 ribokinase/pfkB superfamily kinase [Chitinivibrio alkaliphilus ACht1]